MINDSRLDKELKQVVIIIVRVSGCIRFNSQQAEYWIQSFAKWS